MQNKIKTLTLQDLISHHGYSVVLNNGKTLIFM